MIDMETVAFIATLNELAERSRKGIVPFSGASFNDFDGLLYDDSHPFIDNGNDDGMQLYPLVRDVNTFSGKYDIVSTYTDDYLKKGINIVVAVFDDGRKFVRITSVECLNKSGIIVENGNWYIA